MSYRTHSAELGELIETHRPGKSWVGWLIPILFGLPFGLMAALGPPGPAVGLVIFLGIALPVFYALAESCFLEHRLHEHAVVIRSLPGYPVLFIPHFSIDPDSFEIGGRRVHDGSLEMAIQTGMDRRFRVTPFAADTVRFVGLHPKRAQQLAKGRLSWTDAGSGATLDGKPAPAPVLNWWWLSYQDAQRHRQLIEETVLRSQQTRPHNQAGTPPND